MHTKLWCRNGCTCDEVLTFFHQGSKKRETKENDPFVSWPVEIRCANQARLVGMLDGNSVQGAR